MFAEIGGNTSLVSVNLDVRLRTDLSLRVGVLPDWPYLLAAAVTHHDEDRQFIGGDYETFFGTILLNKLLFTGRHRVELGGGLLFGTSPYAELDYLPRFAVTGTVGYRMMPTVSSLGLRIGFAPTFDGHRLRAYPALSLMLGLGD